MTLKRVLFSIIITSAVALAAEPVRPPIVGVANIAVKVRDLETARKFYGQALGYEAAFTIKQAGRELTCFKVNDRQYIEVSPELQDAKEDRMIHIAFETKDARKLRDYLAAKGVEVPAKIQPGTDGNLTLPVKDPDGHAVDFVQYMPKSIHSRNFGKSMPATRVSGHILHVGIHVMDRAVADRFYKDILGFRLMWEGGPADDRINWISLLVPDGKDWVEYMTGAPNPNPQQLGGMHHACLEVKDMQTAFNGVVERGYTPPRKPIIARDGRWLANFYDPDLTRTEIMIRKPVQTPCCTPLHDPYIE